MVQVRLFASFRENRFKERQMDLPADGTIAEILKQIDIPAQQVGILLVNGMGALPSDKLKDNDTVSIFPALGGG